MRPIDRKISISEAAKQLPLSRNGKPASPTKVGRWSTVGIMVHGRRVKLRTTRIGGQRYVDPKDLDEFLQELNADPPGESSTVLAEESQARTVSPSAAQQTSAAALALTGG